MANANTVIVIGKPGVGKSTIGNQLLGCDLFQVGADYEQNKATSETGDLEVHLISTFSPPQDQPPRSRSHELCKKMTFGLMAGRNTPRSPEEYYRSQIPPSASRVIFVFKQERFTDETKAQFEAVIGVLGENLSKVSALVITCCEGKTGEAKESIIQDVRTNELTKEIAKFMQRGIYCVGFPDKTKIAKQLMEHYVEDIERSQEILRSLVPMAKLNVGTEIGNKEVRRHSSRGCSCNVQ